MKKKKNDNLRVYSFSSLSPDSLLFQRVDVHTTTQLPSLRKSTLQNWKWKEEQLEYIFSFNTFHRLRYNWSEL